MNIFDKKSIDVEDGFQEILIEDLHEKFNIYKDLYLKDIESVSHYTYSILNEHLKNYISPEDLISIGLEKMFEIIPKYDQKRGAGFRTFLLRAIRNKFGHIFIEQSRTKRKIREDFFKPESYNNDFDYYLNNKLILERLRLIVNDEERRIIDECLECENFSEVARRRGKNIMWLYRQFKNIRNKAELDGIKFN